MPNDTTDYEIRQNIGAHVFGCLGYNKYRPYNPIYFWIRVIDFSHLHKFLEQRFVSYLGLPRGKVFYLLVATAAALNSLAPIMMTYKDQGGFPV